MVLFFQCQQHKLGFEFPDVALFWTMRTTFLGGFVFIINYSMRADQFKLFNKAA